ncbi:MAG: L-2-hydroxyglutarate oxidase [Blastopirellula sp.]|nr:MAG: L-2-hydroxyglutarate oxidase [Blastopirellula sp.]
MKSIDVIILGGGIVGLATAYQMRMRFPDRSLLLLEKEPTLAAHQTGHNSGVLHSGIYYKPGSLKAENCRNGKQAMQQFCQQYDIPFDICGKIIVATDPSEFERLENIRQRGQQNQVRCDVIEREQLLELEPHCAGIRALHVPDAGIVNYRQVCIKLGELIEETGAEIQTSAKVIKIEPHEHETIVQTTAGDFAGSYVVNCCGLYSDRVTKISGVNPGAKIIPFRGEYYELTDSAKHLCKNLIYPVPDPSFPFLGVHFTRMISGHVECGPNAVLAFSREGYRKRDINLRDLAETLGYSGFRKLAWKHWRMGLGEMWRSYSKRAFLKSLQRLIPEVQLSDLKTAPAGVRAQALRPNGQLIDDFLIHKTKRMVHVTNAPSPAATSSLNIGNLITNELEQELSGKK